MAARTWALGLAFSVIGIGTGATVGCSSKQKAAEQSIDNSDDTDADASTTPNKADAGHQATDTDAGSPKPSTCVATTPDDPDDTFTDTNCDGIDGDKTKAIFVSVTGSDANDGSMSKPVATMTRAISLATTSKKDVYACAGDYTENVKVDGIGIRVYGGYDCTRNWVRDSNSQARLVSSDGTALTITGAKDAVVFDHVDFDAKAGATGSSSAVAVFVWQSMNVKIRRGTVSAHEGANAVQPTAKPTAENSTPACPGGYVPSTGGCFGEPGTDAYQYKNCYYDSTVGGTMNYMTAPFSDTSTFKLATQSTDTQTNYCWDGSTSVGGKGGGTNSSSPTLPSNGTAGTPATTSGSLDGSPGINGDAAAGATTGFGTLDATGYHPTNAGQSGKPGKIGQAGTGGRGGGFVPVFTGGTGDFPYYLYAPAAGGGKGGWGGCPGQAGEAGNAGGASIAIASYQSQLTLERLTLTTAAGGNGSAGGLGGTGAAGQSGGSSGVAHYQCGGCVSSINSATCNSVNTTNTTSAQSGGKGGPGGSGSQGGAGAGGPSIPLVVVGATPTLSAVTFLPGSGGIGGSNGGARVADGESMDQKIITQ